MATSKISATEGSGVNIATHSFSEDAVTKQLQRVVPSTSAGVETGTAGSPLQVTLANTGANATPIVVDLGANNDVTVTGTVAVTQSGTWDEVGINDSGNSITIDNSTLSVVGGGAEATAMRVTIASDSTGVVSVDDNGASLTVDGTVTANLAAGTNNIGDVDVLTINGVAPAFNTGVRGSTVQRVTIATDDIVPASQSGTWTVQPGNTANTTPWLVTTIPATSGGLTTYHLASAASTNATSVKASAGQLFGYMISNTSAAYSYLAFHNTSGTPTAGSSIFFKIGIPAGGAANVSWEQGIPFSSGIGITTVTGAADSNSTGVASNDLIINLFYK